MSSAATHLGAANPWNFIALIDWHSIWSPAQWAEVLRFGLDDSCAIREATYGGRPLGSQEFVVRLEEYLKRPLKRGTPGRPKRELVHAA